MRRRPAGGGNSFRETYEGRIRPSLIAAATARLIFRAQAYYEGRIRPSLIAAVVVVVVVGILVVATRGEFAPPSLRQGSVRASSRPTRFYEGRIRPSLIAATAGISHQSTSTTDYEGRIRPSLIAAAGRPGFSRRSVRLRGANSPLPHCGVRRVVQKPGRPPATRGEFAPPSLRLIVAIVTSGLDILYEGRIRPSLIAASFPPLSAMGSPTTRGEFAPPSLRHFAAVGSSP